MVPLWQDVYNLLVERAQIPPGASVLDVGAGTGETAIRAARFAGPSGRVIGVDSEDQMLGIARRKSRSLHQGTLEFKQMSFEKLDLDDQSFDRVIGNYSICCCSSYDHALSECLRVLKPGGTITFNQSGPGDPYEFQVAFNALEKYKTGRPSKRLRDIRKADISQKEAVAKYRDPFVTLSTMRTIGFKDAEASISLRTVSYKDVGAFLDRMLAFSWHNEADEMPMENVEAFRKEVTRALKPNSTSESFLVSDEMVVYSGRRHHGP